MLAPKIATNQLYAFTVSVILLATPLISVFGQDDNREKTSHVLETAKQAEELLKEALTLCNTKERDSGRNRLQEAMRLWMQLRQPEKAARASLQMGNCYKQRQSYQDALYYYEMVLDVKSLPGPVKAVTFNSIAQVYAELFQHDLALRYYTKAMEEARRAKDISNRVVASAGLADLYFQQGKRERASAYLAQARKLNRGLSNQKTEAALLHLAGQIALEEGLTERAREAFEESLAIYQKAEEVGGLVRLLCSISNLSLLSTRKQAALEQAEQAVELAQKQAKLATNRADQLSARKLRGLSRISLARAQRALGQKEEAIKSFSLGISYLEGIWWSVHLATETSASADRENRQAFYRELVDLLVEQGEFEVANQWAERARTKALSVLTNARHQIGPSEKADQDETLRDLSRSIARLRTQLIYSKISPQQRAKLQRDIKEEEYAREEARLKTEMEYARDRLVWFQPVFVKQLQEKLIPEKSSLLEFFLGEDRSFVWLISSDHISVEIIPGQKEIEKAVREYIEYISTAPNNLRLETNISRTRERAKKLFSMLLGRLAGRIEPGRKLIVVPDGLLHYLPFESLIHNGRYLVEDHEISYTPSASMLALWQNSESRAEAEDKMELLAFGDPIFGPEAKSAGNRDSMRGLEEIVRQALDSGSFQLAPLPRTRDEVEYIAELFPSDRRQVYLGKESIEEVVKRKSLRQFRRLHFATHGLIDELSPSRSAILLTLDDDPEEDGFLEAREISELDLDCDLVVLSACQTGRGQLLSGEGIIGLSRSFLYAGARSVVVSLWNVSDISTGRLMKSFYQRLADDNSNAAALRQAKLHMLQSDTETRHPYYWAPFIIIGKP